MSAEVLYSGPGKLFFNGVPFQADGVNGQINAVLDEKTTERGTAMAGRVLETWDDIIGRVTVTPWDSWGILGALFPAYIGATTAQTSPYTVAHGQGTGQVQPGIRPHDLIAGTPNGLAAAKIWTQDGRLYNFVRAAITKHPGLKLGVGVPLYEQCELTCLGDPTLNPGASSFLIAGNAITESSQSGGAGTTDPDTTGFSLADFVNGKWTGLWGTGTQWGGIVPLEPEDYWTLVTDVKYSPLTVQKLTRHYKFDSANFMIKARLIGPTHTQMLGEILTHTQGQIMTEASAADLVLSGPNSKTITLKNCEIKGAGFEFGGTRLGTGEVGFVTQMTFTSGTPQPLIIFSA